ncbi:MAG: hypothetical protein HYZ90_03385 [Candidatus Omnitrophica bacterium]|nr:hypothetical protein [Candidatus Omnitrophota bacterium]
MTKVQSLLIVGLSVGAALAFPPKPAFAHLRDYIFNQGYHTSRKGEFEIELHNDLNLKEADNDESYSSKHQVELEYGVTDHLQLATYEVFKWDRKDDFERDELKVEGKVRLLESGELPVDIALYGEYKNPNGHHDQRSDAMELKLILSKDLGPWNVTGNLITERKINQHDPWAFEYTLGISRPVHPQVRLGLEIKEGLGTTEDLGVRRKGHKFQLMPMVAWSPTPHSRVLFGPAFGLTRASDDIQLKSIASIEF